MSDATIIQTIRRFNRYYTNVLGLLDQHLLNSDFSLSEARVLYEIQNTEHCTAKMLIDKLSIDAGYLSRILKRFDKLGLIYRVQSDKDGRSYYLYLSDQGREMLHKLDALSDEQIRKLIEGLSEHRKGLIAKSMTAIEGSLSGEEDRGPGVVIRTELRPGDVGVLIHLHGWLYAEECGYNHGFEGYVCKTFHEFFQHYDREKDRFWLAEADGHIVGAIAIVGHTPDKAQLRWFILHPDFRGRGLGKTLLNEAVKFCREKGYRNVFLETTEDQKNAIRMYENVGFRKTGERPNEAWGVSHVEQVFELHLP